MNIKKKAALVSVILSTAGLDGCDLSGLKNKQKKTDVTSNSVINENNTQNVRSIQEPQNTLYNTLDEQEIDATSNKNNTQGVRATREIHNTHDNTSLNKQAEATNTNALVANPEGENNTQGLQSELPPSEDAPNGQTKENDGNVSEENPEGENNIETV